MSAQVKMRVRGSMFRMNLPVRASLKRTTVGLGVCLGWLLFCLPSFAQLNLGRIDGTITDQSGGVIVGAEVTVIDAARGISRPLITDSAGEYSAPSLTPSTYTVRAKFKGFKVVEQNNIAVGVGQDVRVDLSLPPGEQAQTVTVTSQGTEINTSNAQLGGLLPPQELSELPLNGRQYTNLLAFQPGVLPIPGQSVQIVPVNGMRAQDSEWLLDGLEDYNAFSSGGPLIGGSATSGDQATILPLDAIQDVNIVLDPQAEYGWKPGAVVNTGLKSGTNSIHGTAYAFGRDTVFDAKNSFLSPTTPTSLDQLMNFGGSIGGPIKKDKLFYFGNYEGQRYTIGTPKTVQIPSSVSGAGVSGSFPQAIAAMNAAHHPISPLSLNLAGCTSAGVCNPAAGLFTNGLTSSTVPSAVNNVGGSDNFVTKIDYHLNDRNAVNGEYIFGNGNEDISGNGVQPYWKGGSNYRAQIARGVWIWTPNSTWVNEARIGYDRANFPSFPAECIQNLGQPDYATAYGFVSGAGAIPPQCGFPLLTISGFTQLGAAAGTNIMFATKSFTDSVSFTRGKHLIKFGGELYRTTFVGAIKLTNYTGTLSFGTGGVSAFTGATPLEDFLSGVPSTGSLLIGNSQRHIHFDRYAGFIEDDWRFRPRITANLGLRYEYKQPITEQNNLFGNFDPSTPSGLVQQSSGHPVYSPDHKEFEPRLGLVWDVTGKGTTVVRSGFGIQFEVLNLNTLTQTPNGAQLNAVPTGFALHQTNGATIPSPGNIQTGTVTLTGSQLPWAENNPVFSSAASALTCGNGLGQVNPATSTGAANPANPPPCSLAVMDPNFREPYIVNWNLNVQQALTNTLLLSIGYVGNHGTKLGGLIDLNQPAPGSANGATAPTSGNEQIRRPYYNQFPWFSRIVYYSGDMESNYNALQVNLQERASHGLTFTANYAWAHSLDQDSQENSSTVMNGNDLGLEYGNSTYDGRHHFAIEANYNIPGKKSFLQSLEGWQVTSSVNLISAFPYNAADTTSDISGTGELADRWTLVGSPSAFKGGGPSALPCYGATGSSFAQTANCTSGLPAPCVAAAAAEPNGPGGTTGTASLNSKGCYMENGSVIVPPAQGTYGNMGRNVLRQYAFSEWDGSVLKNWKYGERLTTQARVEVFNVLNSREFAAPSSNPSVPSTFGQSQSTPNASAVPNPVIGTGGPRVLQLGLKFIF
jgi:hypothetical protein